MAHPEVIIFLLTTAWGLPLGPTFGGYFQEGFPFQEVARRVASWSPDQPENVWELSGQYEGDIMLLPQQEGSSRNIITNEETRWPDATLPYYIDPIFSEKERGIIEGALKEFNEKSCVKLVPHKDEDKSSEEKSFIRSLPVTHDDNDEDASRLFNEKKKPASYIWIRGESTGCWSMVGRQKSQGLLSPLEDKDDSSADLDSVEQDHPKSKRSGTRKNRSFLETLGSFITGPEDKGPGPGGQVVNLQRPGCVHHGVVVHEVLHALGFFHQQSAYNRDEYVEIKWDKIEKGKENNFQKYNESQVTDFGVEYDYTSVMHYGRTAFSKDGSDTIVPKQEGARIGQRNGMSEKDAEKLIRTYCKQKEES